MTHPPLSVVIPALNEQAVLGDCLASIAAQDYPGPIEVIVVDNGSTDRTAEIARSLGARVVSEATRGVCHARQRGTEAATGEIVVSTDADSTFPPSWLRRIAAVLADRPDVVATCGPCRFVDAPRWAHAYTGTVFGVTAWMYRRTRRVIYASATNIAFRRAAFPGYDLHLTQGGDELGLLRRLRVAGEVHFDPGRITLTSARRLRRGFVYSAFVTCLWFYLAAYALNRATGRTVLGGAPVLRDDDARLGVRSRIATTGCLVVTIALAVAWWRTSADVV